MHRPVVIGVVQLAPDHLERADDLVRRVVDADDALHEAAGQVDAGDLDGREERPADLGVEGSAGVLHHQVGHASCRDEGDQGVDTALEAP